MLIEMNLVVRAAPTSTPKVFAFRVLATCTLAEFKRVVSERIGVEEELLRWVFVERSSGRFEVSGFRHGHCLTDKIF